MSTHATFSSVPPKTKLIIYSLAFQNVAAGYFFVVVAAYLPEVSVSSSAVGLLLGLVGIVAAAGGIPLGVLSDRKGRKTILLLGSVGFAPAIIVFALTTNIFYLAMSAAIFGLSEAGTLSTWNAIIADQTKLESRDSAFSLSFIVTTGSMAFGSLLPFAFPALQSITGLGTVAVHRFFLALLGLCALGTPLCLRFLLRGYAEVPSHSKLARGKNFPLLLKFSGITSLVGFGAGFIIPLIPTWFYLRFAVPDTYSGPLLAASNATIALAAVVSPKLSRRFGLVRAIAIAQGSSMIFMLSMAFAPNAAVAGGIYIVRAALMNMSAPLADSYLMGIMSQEERGLASSVSTVLWRIPNSATTIVGGAILQMGSYEAPFYLATAFYVVSTILFYGKFRRIRPQS